MIYWTGARLRYGREKDMLGGITGDIIGSPYEFINLYSEQEIKPFAYTLRGKSQFTDDSVLSIAVARALIENRQLNDMQLLGDVVAGKIQEYYHKYPLKRGLGSSSYGSGFVGWVNRGDVREKRSASTNGGAMRIVPVGWLYSSLEKTLEIAKVVTERSHNSEAAIESAKMVAAAVFLSRRIKDKQMIKQYARKVFGYTYTEDEMEYQKIQKANKRYRKEKMLRFAWNHWIDCDARRTVSEALFAFFDTDNFQDCIRRAIALGGDSDTIACMAGGIAEAFYGGVPVKWKQKTIEILNKHHCAAEDVELVMNFQDYAAPLVKRWEKELPEGILVKGIRKQ